MPDHTSIPGLTPTGVAGVGANGPIMSGQWNGTPVTIRYVRHGAVPLGSQIRRLQKLSDISCEHIAKVVHVEATGDHLTVLSEHVEGPTLATVRAGNSGLTLAEGWRVLADLSTALISLHTAGVIHGDISPANVIIRSEYPQGRAVVIDVGGEEEWELGTVGFRAPEIASGAPASGACDVWAAARTALWAVSQEHRAIFGELLKEVLHPDPARRPDPQWLREHAEGRASARIGLPDEARLATAHLRVHASRMHTTRAGRRKRRNRGRLPRLLAPVSVAGFLTLTMLTLGIVKSGHNFSPPAPVPTSGATQEQARPAIEVALEEPQEAVIELTRQRDRALEKHDLQLLEEVSVPGSQAAQADVDLIGSFGGSAPVGLRTSVEVGAVTGTPENPVVRAVLQQGAFTWHGGTNHGVHVDALPPRCAQIHLVESNSAWVVQQISACAAPEPSG